MISARSGKSDITDILVEGEHIDLDIQENVRICTCAYMYSVVLCIYMNIYVLTMKPVCVCVYPRHLHRALDGLLSILQLREGT